MRISTAWTQQIGLDAMNKQQAKISKAQQQMSSGTKLLTPADDPVAATKVLNLEGAISKLDQYKSNIEAVRGRLTYEESALNNSTEILDQVRELVVRAKSETLNNSDRLGIKFEVDQLAIELVGSANTKNANGEYVFSGDFSLVPPFAKHPTTGEYVYQGGPQQRVLQIGTNRQIADGDLGVNLYENIDSTSPAADENGKRSIFNTLKSLSDALGGNFSTTPGEISGDRFLKYGLDYAGATAQFTLTANADVTPATVPPTAVALPSAPIDLSGMTFAGVENIVTEINNQLMAGALPAGSVAPNTNLPVGSKFSDAIQARSNGNRIEFVSVAKGTTSSIKINNTSGTFLTDAGFSNGQVKIGADFPATSAQPYQDQLNDALGDINSALDKLEGAKSSLGTRQNALSNQDFQNQAISFDTKAVLSGIKDIDFAEAISRFQAHSTTLQAAQQAFAKVHGLSLFNYI